MQKKLRFIVAMVVGLFVSTQITPVVVAQADTTDPSTAGNVNDLDATQTKYVEKTLKASHFTGTALFYRKGKVVYQKGYGYADATKQIKNSADSLYPWASVEKSLTAVLLMHLVENGQINLNTKLARYYPKIAGGNQVTLRQMLDMRSGLWLSKNQDFYSANDQDVVNFAVKYTKFQASGLNQWDYQPVNFLLLAGIVEQVSGRTFAQEAKKVIFEPLKLKNTGFMPASGTKTWSISYRNTRAPESYDRPETISKPTYNRELGTGNIYSTAGDLFKIQQAIIHGKIISSTTLAQLRDGTDGSYRGGIYNYANHVYSRGCLAGYEVTMLVDNTGKNGIVLMGNRYFNGKQSPESKTSRALTNHLYQKVIQN